MPADDIESEVSTLADEGSTIPVDRYVHKINKSQLFTIAFFPSRSNEENDGTCLFLATILKVQLRLLF